MPPLRSRRILSLPARARTCPGTKSYAVRAVRAGGAVMHRLGLSETILVFPEHRAFLTEPLHETVRRLRRAAPEKKLVIEVDIDRRGG